MFKMTKNERKAFWLGVRDGFTQPYEVSSSPNVEYLDNGVNEVYETLDRGINVGQFIRAGFRSEAWLMGYPILFIRNKNARQKGFE